MYVCVYVFKVIVQTQQKSGKFIHVKVTNFRYNKHVLTFPTYCGSDPMYSSRTKNWFHTQPLLIRWALNLPCLHSLVLCSDDVSSATDVLTFLIPLVDITASLDLLWG